MNGPRGQHGFSATPPQQLSHGVRFMGWSRLEALACPAGHHIRQDAFVFTDGGVRCKWRDPRNRQECGRLLYLLACVPARSPESQPSLFFVAEVTYPELQELQRQRLGPLEALELLGATFPRRVPVRAPDRIEPPFTPKDRNP